MSQIPGIGRETELVRSTRVQAFAKCALPIALDLW
jgi:hypothetical protein